VLRLPVLLGLGCGAPPWPEQPARSAVSAANVARSPHLTRTRTAPRL